MYVPLICMQAASADFVSMNVQGCLECKKELGFCNDVTRRIVYSECNVTIVLIPQSVSALCQTRVPIVTRTLAASTHIYRRHSTPSAVQV
jgi:hypothetical protein